MKSKILCVKCFLSTFTHPPPLGHNTYLNHTIYETKMFQLYFKKYKNVTLDSIRAKKKAAFTTFLHIHGG